MSKLSSTRDFNFHAKGVLDVRWSCDGQYLGSASTDKTCKISQLDANGMLRMIHSVTFPTAVTKVAWHPQDSNRFAIIGEDKTVELWDVRGARPSCRMFSTGSNLNMDWSPDGRSLAIGTKMNVIQLFDVASQKLLSKLKLSYEANELAWTANSDNLIVGTYPASCGCLDVFHVNNENNELGFVASLPAHSSKIFSVVIDPTFRLVAAGGHDNLVSLWDLAEVACSLVIQMDCSPRQIVFNGSGNLLAVPSVEKSQLSIYNSATGECVHSMTFKNPSRAVAWHPTKSLLVNCPTDKDAASFLQLIALPPLE